MALQKINWTQIDTQNVPTGTTIDLGMFNKPLNAVYAENLYLNGAPISTDILSGSIWMQTGSFFATTNDIQITGSLTISGSLLVDGGTIIGDGSGLTNVGAIDKVFYVSEQGNDTYDGKTLSTSFRTIKSAALAAGNLILSNPGFPPYRVSIQVKTGYYVEEAPITVPTNTSIIGDDLRTVVIRPTTATKGENLFLMNNSSYAWGLRLEGCEIDNLEDPRRGFYFAFAPNAFLSTSPYVQNCSAIFTPSDKFYAPLDFDNANPSIGNGPGGMLIDDSVLHPYSPLKSMIVDAYTQVAFNGIGICIRGRGYGQLVSFFTNFSRIGVYCIDGGHASLLNSNTTFGDYGLRSKGKRILVTPTITGVTTTIDTDASLLIKSEKNSIRSYMINKLILSGSYNESYSNSTSSIYLSTITDSGLLIDAISDDLLSVKPARTMQFVQGLFKGQDVSSGSIYTLPPPTTGFTQGAIAVFPLVSNSSGSLAEDFVLSYEYIKEYIVIDPDNKFLSFSGATKNKVTELLNIAIDTVQRVVVDNQGEDLLKEFGSLITSTSHDFSYAGAGVNFLSLPENQGGIGETIIERRVVEEGGGRVYHTSGDETGDFFAGNDFVIRQGTGTIEGRTFYKAISSVITPINLALESQ